MCGQLQAIQMYPTKDQVLDPTRECVINDSLIQPIFDIIAIDIFVLGYSVLKPAIKYRPFG